MLFDGIKRRVVLLLWFGLTLWGALPSPSAFADSVDADVLLQGGTIVDGTGEPGFPGDVAIQGDRIVAVGKFEPGKVALMVDCRGLVIAPGFIDLHNHSDRQVVDPQKSGLVNYLTQGCTTIVTGNCGAGPVNVAAYREKLTEAGVGTNVAHLLPQGSLRSSVMGTALREPSAEEMQEMKRLADKAMQEGAWGMSTGLIYVPGTYAKTEELVEIAKVVSQSNGIYASHIRNENTNLLAAVDEALRIGKEAELPVHISHFKSSGRDAWGLVRRAVKQIETARERGQVVTADQYPYIASSTSLDATIIPTWARAGGRSALIKRLDDREQGERIRRAMTETLKKKEGGGSIQIARYAPHQNWVGKRLSEIARQEGKSPTEIGVEIAKNGGAAIVNFSMDEADVRHVMRVPWVATASDGRAYLPGADKPHPRNYGTFPRKLGYYAIKEKVLSQEAAVRSATSLPAKILGLTDRGTLKTGWVADVIVFDPEKIRDAATFEEPHQYSRGIRYVYVNGQPAIFRGSPTGARPGKALVHSSKRK